MFVPQLESFRRRHGDLYCFPKQVKGCLGLFLVELAIHCDSTFLSGVCQSCRRYAFDDVIHIRFVVTPGQVVVAVPTAKLLINEVVSFFITFMQ